MSKKSKPTAGAPYTHPAEVTFRDPISFNGTHHSDDGTERRIKINVAMLAHEQLLLGGLLQGLLQIGNVTELGYIMFDYDGPAPRHLFWYAQEERIAVVDPTGAVIDEELAEMADHVFKSYMLALEPANEA